MLSTFSTLSSIKPDTPESWEKQLFLALDIDWASDEVLHTCIDILEETDVKATWFVTHQTPVLERLRTNPNFELGIHPNFNPLLLQGSDEKGKNARDIVEKVLEIVPEARCVRSHSLVQSSYLMLLFKELGLTHDINHHVPWYANASQKPWQCWSGLVKVPFFWQDDLTLMNEPTSSVIDLKKRSSVKVFCFHPIHIVLNTESQERYQSSKQAKSFSDLKQLTYSGFGIHTHLQTLLNPS